MTTIPATAGVHNTVCTPDGQRVYVGGGWSDVMTVIATADNSVLRHLGPLGGFVRPFTMDVGERWLFANVNGLLGFEVVDAQSGAILYRVSPPGYPFDSTPDYTQSHGVAMSPDGRETPPPAVDTTLAEVLNPRSKFHEEIGERRPDPENPMPFMNSSSNL